MKKLLCGSLLLVIALVCLVSCNANVDEKIFNANKLKYEIQNDGSWLCTAKGNSTILAGTDKPYITVLKNGQPVEIIPLTAGITKTVGYGTVTVSDDEEVTTYTNISSNAQKVCIRTSRGKLVVNGKIGSSPETSDEILHYGYAVVCNVKVADYCFYTHAVVGQMNLTSGKVIADKNGYVGLINAANNTHAEERNGGIIVIPKDTTSTNIDISVAESLGYKVDENNNTYVTDPDTEKGQEKIRKIAEIASKQYSISTKEELIFFRENYNSGNHIDTREVVLTSDIDLSDTKWVPIGTWEFPYHGKFNGQGHKIIGLNPADPTTVVARGKTTGYGEVFGLFGIVGDIDGDEESDIDVEVSNVIFTNVNITGSDDLKNVGTVIGYAPTYDDFTSPTDEGKGYTACGDKWNGTTDIGKTSIKISNVTVSGSIDVNAHAGGFIGKLYDESCASLENCVCDISITTHDLGGLAGFIGYGRNSSAVIKGCSFTGNAHLKFDGNDVSVSVGDYFAGLDNSGYTFNLTLTTNTNSGSIGLSFANDSIKMLTNCFTEKISLTGMNFNVISNRGAELELENCVVSSNIKNYSSLVSKNCTCPNIYNYGTFIVNGGTFTTIRNYNLMTFPSSNTCNCNKINNYGTLIVNGGTFTKIENIDDGSSFVDNARFGNSICSLSTTNTDSSTKAKISWSDNVLTITLNDSGILNCSITTPSDLTTIEDSVKITGAGKSAEVSSIFCKNLTIYSGTSVTLKGGNIDGLITLKEGDSFYDTILSVPEGTFDNVKVAKFETNCKLNRGNQFCTNSSKKQTIAKIFPQP